MWNEMSWDRMPGTGTEVPTIGEFLAGNPVPHLVPHDMSVTHDLTVIPVPGGCAWQPMTVRRSWVTCHTWNSSWGLASTSSGFQG